MANDSRGNGPKITGASKSAGAPPGKPVITPAAQVLVARPQQPPPGSAQSVPGQSISAQASAAQFLATRVGWKQEARRGALLGAKFILAPAFVWMVFVKLGILPMELSGMLSMLLAVVLFVLSLPLGALLRLDQIVETFALSLSAEVGLIVAAVIVTLNFGLLFGLRGLFRGKRAEKVSVRSGPASTKKTPR